MWHTHLVANTSNPASSKVLLAVGKETVLVGRVIESAITSARSADPNFVRLEIAANSDDAAGEFANAMSPSLFGELTVLVVTGIDSATDELSEQITKYISNTPEHIRLVITHPGGIKGKRLLEIIRKAGAIEANCSELKSKDLEAALVAEFKKHGRKVTSDAISQLQTSLGTGLGELLSAVSQLCTDVEAQLIEQSHVSTYYSGVSDVMGWTMSDAMWNAQPLEVLEQLRWSLQGDSASAVPAISAISNGLRALVKFAGAPAGMSDNELAGVVGVPPWKLRMLRNQKNRWTPEQLATAARLLAQADRASKGTSYDSGIPGGKSLDTVQSQYRIEKDLMAIRPPKN
jgi:DNA polymerase-3 subunit delta